MARGRIDFNDGRCWIGYYFELKGGTKIPHGEGEMYYPNGYRYKGQYVLGEKYGKGVVIDLDENVHDVSSPICRSDNELLDENGYCYPNCGIEHYETHKSYERELLKCVSDVNFLTRSADKSNNSLKSPRKNREL